MFAKRVAGVEFCDNSIKVVELKGSEKSHKVISYGKIEMPDNIVSEGVILNKDAAAANLQRLWESESIRTKDIVFGVDNKYVLVRYADIKSDGRNFKLDLEQQIQKFLPVNRNSVELDYVQLSKVKEETGEQTIKTMLVAGGKKMLNDYIEVFQKNKLNIKDIDVNTLAIHRVLPTDADKDNGVMIVNFKKILLNLLIVKDGQPLLARNIAIDIDSNPDEAEFMQDYYEAVNREIISSLAYYNSITGDYIEKIFVSGYGVSHESMVQSIQKDTKSDIRVVNPFVNEKNKTITPMHSVLRQYEYAVAYSLALKGLESE